MSSGCGDVLSLADLQTAKKHQIFEAEVITGKSGGVASGADIDYATNQVTGQTQKTLPAVLRDIGYTQAVFTFTTGGTLSSTDRDKAVFDPVSKAWYTWVGELPKVVPAGANPVGDSDWKPWTDPTLRADLLANTMDVREDGRLALANIVFAQDFERTTDTNPIQFIQRAMDYCAANNKDLCISKLYQINAPLVYKGSGFYFPAIYGVGGNSGLQKTTNTTTGATSPDVFGINWNVDAVIVIPAITNQPKTVVIDRLTISGTDTVTPAYGIFTTKCENFDVTRCVITKVDLGMLDSGSWVSSVEKTVFRRVGSGGYKKLTGTSTYLRRCYVDISAGFGFWVKSGYSGIHDCACDKTSTYSYIVEGDPSETTSDITYLISNCGSENSGSGAPIKIIGAAFTTVDTFTAFNWDQQQVPTPAAFIEIEANFTHVVLNNVRYIGVGKFLNEIGQQNVIYITGRTTRTPSIPFGTYQANTKIIEMSQDGVKFSRGADTAGIALTNEDITDGNTNQNWCGLRNKKVVIRGSVSVTRTSGQPYGQATFTIPISLANYHVAASVISGDLTSATTHIPICTATKGTNNIVITVVSANGSVAWGAFSVELVISGVRT